jgi:hypothetical protein
LEFGKLFVAGFADTVKRRRQKKFTKSWQKELAGQNLQQNTTRTTHIPAPISWRTDDSAPNKVWLAWGPGWWGTLGLGCESSSPSFRVLLCYA